MSQAITLLGYWTTAIRLLFFSAAIGLSEYRISDWRIPDTIRLSYIRSRLQSIGLSDNGCPPLHILDQGLNLSDYHILDLRISVACRVPNFEKKIILQNTKQDGTDHCLAGIPPASRNNIAGQCRTSH
jgi:hypothetical protein